MPKKPTQPPGLPPGEWVAYDLALAQELLDRNTHNRNIRDYMVELFARDMAAGRWQMNGETIKVSKTGVLLDGQHRLLAVVYAYKELGLTEPIWIYTISEVEDPAQQSMDAGIRRGTHEVLALAGYTNSTVVSAAAKQVMQMERGTLFDRSTGGHKMSNNDVLDWLNGHPAFAIFVEEWTWRARQTRVPGGPCVAALWWLWNIDDKGTEQFLEQWVTLENLPAKSPVLALNRVVSDVRTRKRRMTAATWIGMIFQAWNHWVTGGSVTYLRLPQNGFTEDRFPWPHAKKAAR
jgi:hypothetical protein